MTQTLQDIMKKTKWFREDRFGMFIHWGLYAIPGRGEWVRSHEEMPAEDYEGFLAQFNPEDFDPKKWAQEAKNAGMKYVVLTAKHHDGFCLFDSQYTDFKITNTPIKRDLVAEFLDAFRDEGIKVGLYFTLIDWRHPDYPKYGDFNHPMRNNEAYKDEEIDFNNYLTHMHNQIEEVVSNYGKIDILWFDFSYDDMVKETWEATQLMKMVRKHQPDVIIDNRLETSGEGFGSIVTDNISDYSGDFVSPEQIIPHEGIRNYQNEFVPWELCITMNNSWGYTPTDYLYKSSKTLIRKLVECVSKNGNMLLNIGPDAKGVIPEPSIDVLRDFNKWMSKNGESIYGCGYAEGLDKPEWGYYTQKDNVIYAHVFEQPIGPLALIGINEEDVKCMTLLHDGSEVRISKSWTTKAYEDILFVQFGSVDHFTYPLADEVDTVIKIELK